MGAGDSWYHLSLIAAVVSAVAQTLILISVPITVYLYRKNQRSLEKIEKDKWDRFYALLDDFYFKILSMTIEKPHLAIQDPNRSGEAAVEYDAYAFIVWNFIESIFDYGQKNAEIVESWKPILIIEAKRHGAWFADTHNRRGFKTPFCNYIDENRYAIN